MSRAQEAGVLSTHTFGRHVRKVDVYAPAAGPGCGQRSMHTTGTGQQHAHAQLRPVAVFVHGGAWASGRRQTYGHAYGLLGQFVLVEQCGAVAFVPAEYTGYPHDRAPDSVAGIIDLIEWIVDHAHTFNGDGQQIFLFGHSAGAHLASLAVIELAAIATNSPQSEEQEELGGACRGGGGRSAMWDRGAAASRAGGLASAGRQWGAHQQQAPGDGS